MNRTLRGACATAALLAVLSSPLAAQPIGINLTWWTNYHPEWVFVDAFKGASDWVPQKRLGGPWDTGEPIALRADSYPAHLTADQAVAALMFKDVGGQYPGGRYVVLWDGDGDVEVGHDARLVHRAGNRIEADVTPRDGMLLRIVRTNPADPVRNVRVVMPGFEHTYQTQPFHPRFLANWRGFPCVRFMDWGRTNGSQLAHWGDRPTPWLHSQATERGVAVEYMVALCNQIDADLWICLPHLATDDYARQLGRVLAFALERERRVYVEYSNECWNGSFAQARYCRDEGLRNQLSSDSYQAQLRFYSQRAVHLLRIVQQELAPTHRVTRVLAAQNAGPWTGTTVLDWQGASQHVEALAVAPYFGDELGDPNRQHDVSQWSVAQVLEACWRDLDGTFATTAAHARAARQRGVELIAYEGGQHLAGYDGAQDNAALTALFVAANRHPGMATLYSSYLLRWSAVGGGLMTSYASTSTPSRWGSWGALEWSGQDPLTAPKYVALRLWQWGWRLHL